MPSPYLFVSPRIDEAIRSGRAVVALETTLVTHGLPHPIGLDAARGLEAAVRELGAEPATIGVLAGVVHVGLGPAELDRLARAERPRKLNLGNLAAAVGQGVDGSTTVSATCFAAARAGIRVFATGGIGGVHRDVIDSFDISADLGALARFPVAVVCAGVKAILDLPRTVELLESLGVPVYGFGTASLPAFYRRESGLPVDARFDDIASLARAITAHVGMGLPGGVLVGSPIPDGHELAVGEEEDAIARAIEAAAHAKIRGRALTPFLLDRVREATSGRSVAANLALLDHNARVAASLALALRT